jgi:peptidoglycan/xylan/chitin deacetylase (PgdA/CDA1 family)
VNPLLIGLVALVVIIAAIGLATRGGDAPTSRGTADPVIPAVTTSSASADQLGPLDQELVSIGEKGVSIHSAGGRRKVVALTFDDGPGKDTPSVLSILKQNNVPATFFVVGREIQANPQMLSQQIAQGHQLGVHTWDHQDMTKLSSAKQQKQIVDTQNAIINATGTPSRLFRAPYGAVSPSVIATAQKNKLLSVLWETDPNDWQQPDAATIVQRVMSQVTPGTIILLHDGGGDRASTVAALPTIIKELKKQGYEFATVGDLVISDPPTASDMSVDGKGVTE